MESDYWIVDTAFCLDVKNILVLQNWLERIRKEVTNKVLSIKRISEFLNFPILAQPTLKKI